MRLSYSTSEMEQYIRQAAVARGIDPDIAVRVAKSEGLGEGVWQSNYKKGSIREPSYGPFQLLMGGKGTGFPVGMGNAFKRETGLDPSKPENAFAAVDYALDRAVEDGWGAWYGAKKIGVTGKRGISSNAKPLGVRGRRGVSEGLSQFMGQTDPGAALQDIEAGALGLPRYGGLFETYDALGDMNVRADPLPPNAKPPAPPREDVGPLSQRDYGYQTAKTVEDLRAAIDPNYTAPEVPSASLTGVGNAGVGGIANASGGIDVGGLFGPATSDVANSRITNAFEDVAQPTQPQTPSYPEPRQIASVPADRLDQTFGLFDPGAETVATSDVQPASPIEAQQSPLQPLAPSQTVAPRQVAQPQEPQLDLAPNAAPSVADTVSGYGLFGDAGDGFSYGYSPWGSGVAKVHDSADERTKIAATGPGLFGAFNKEFGTNIGLSPGKMMTPLASALGAGAAVAGLGPLALALPAANALGGTNWLASKMDVVPREQWQQPRQNNNFLSNLFNGNPLQNFAGGLFNAPQQAASAVGGLFGGNSNQNEVSFNGPIGRNQRDVSLDSMSQAARNEIERATRGLY